MDTTEFTRRMENEDHKKNSKENPNSYHNFGVQIDNNDNVSNLNKNLKLPWETKDALSFVMSIFQLARQITLICIGIPLIFVGYR